MSAIVSVRDLCKEFPVRGRGVTRGTLRAVDGVSFTVEDGESIGLVGESGSGKTTTARIVCGLERPTSGDVTVAGFDLGNGTEPGPDFYHNVQMIFQDPYLSLSPRMTIRQAVGYELRTLGVGRAERLERVANALARVGLPVSIGDRYPHELSTGQRQRVGIARAIIGEPRIVVADEPLSSLDVSLQTQILNLLVDIQQEQDLSYILISHDLAVVAYLCDRVLIMKDGRVVEEGSASAVLHSPKTDYAQLLVKAGLGDPVIE